MIAVEAQKILVTPRSLTSTDTNSLSELDPLRELGYEITTTTPGQVPTPAELTQKLPGVVGWLAGIEPITAATLQSATRLRVISRNGTGSENVDQAAAEAHGIEVRTARGANAQGVAELAVTHILNALRHLTSANAAMHAGEWGRKIGKEASEVTVGLVGMGAIGAKVAQVFHQLDATIHFYDPFVSNDRGYQQHSSLGELLTASDVVSLHVPAIDGVALIGSEELAAMRQGTILVNTARSALIDEAIVLAGLESGKIQYYAVDAFDQEPPVMTPLLQHPNTIMTPHAGGFTSASTKRATEQAVSNIIESLNRS